MNECCVRVFYISFFDQHVSEMYFFCTVLTPSLIHVNVSLSFGCKGHSIYIYRCQTSKQSLAFSNCVYIQ